MQKVMFCCSTQNQTVNLIPALMEKVPKIVLFTTVIAEKWTENLREILNNRDIECENVPVSKQCEQNIKELADKIREYADKYKDHEILLNIGGGQKPFTVAFSEVFRNSVSLNMRMVYSEANTHTLYSVKKDLDQDHDVKYKVDLTLEEILKSYGYELFNDPNKNVKSNVKIVKNGELDLSDLYDAKDLYIKAEESSGYLKKDRLYQELFYRKMMNEELNETITYSDLIRDDILNRIIETYEPDLNNVLPAYKKVPFDQRQDKFYAELKERRSRIRKLIESTESCNTKDELVTLVKEICKDSDSFFVRYGEKAFMKRIVNDLSHELSYNFRERKQYNVPVRSWGFDEEERKRISEMFDDVAFDFNGNLFVGGDYSYNFQEKNGDFFEKMVTSEVCNIRADSNINEIWLNVKTKKKESNKNNNEAEYDIVVVTKFGTLILLEVKSAKFDNKIAKGQERDVLQKSGPYGKATIIGPLLKKMKRIDSPEREFQYPFVAKAFYDQAEKVEDAGMQYWCFDEIGEKLKELLKD